MIEPAYGLHDYQRQVFRDIIDILTAPQELVSPGVRVLAHLPTGSGKTRIAARVASELLGLNDNPDALVVWLASGEELLSQAANELERAWHHLGNREISIQRVWGSRDIRLERSEGGVLVAGLAKLRASSNRDASILAALSERVVAVIFDEAHQAPAETYEYVTEQLLTYRPALLGLTATPGRGWGLSDEDERLGAMFHYNRVVIDSRGHSNAVAFLIENGYLAEPRFSHVDFDSGITNSVSATEQSDYESSLLDALGEDDFRNQRIVTLISEELLRSKRIIVFCPSVASALSCCELLVEQGHRANVITANTPDEDRTTTVAEFRDLNGPPMTLFNYGVLTAGFDAPATRSVVIARPTRSVVLYSQMAGRALRGPRSGGNRTSWIHTVVDTGLPGFRSVAEAFSNWEALWS